MWTFFKILLFGGSTVLTPLPVDVGTDWVTITPSEHLEVITDGAGLVIDLGDRFGKANILARIEKASKSYPDGCVHARLIDTAGHEIQISNRGAGASNTDTYVYLTAPAGISTGKVFSKIQISASCQLTAVKLLWKNFSE